MSDKSDKQALHSDQERAPDVQDSEVAQSQGAEYKTDDASAAVPEASVDAGLDGANAALPDAAASDEALTADAVAATTTSEPGKKKKKNNKKKPAKDKGMQQESPVPEAFELGTTKGVQTMFRNAFRTEMDLLSLAATKANIMISLNGFIVSALMISGAFIFSDALEFLIPAGIFMCTAASSIVFAMLSASPMRAGKLRTAWGWLKDFFGGRASLRDFRGRVLVPEASFVDKTPNILIYEDRVKIPKDQYWEIMQGTMADRQQVYRAMSDELYWLGQMANKHFKFLHLSYTVFRWGLLASILTFVVLRSLPGMVPALQEQSQTAALAQQGVRKLKGIYEPSAVQSLPDGRLLVAEDEHTHAFSVIRFDNDGNIVEDEALDTRIIRGFKRKISDLEGLALDDEGYVYAVTSHSRTREGLRRPEREYLMRFRIQNNDVQELVSFNRLTDALQNSAQLQALLKARLGATIDFSTINIEGLAFDPQSKRLMLGLRKPEFEQKAIVIYIGNPKQLFARKAAPEFVDVAVLDIQGGGIRSLNYDPVLKAFVLSNEVKDAEGNKTSQLWTWSGAPDDQPKAVEVPDLQHLTNVEAIDSVVINGQPRLLMMSDEGNVRKNVPGKYILVDYDEL